MKRIAFLGYNQPDGKTFYNGVVRVIYNMATYLQQHGYEIFYYHLFSKSEYDGLETFLKQNQIDIAIWHGTTLKIRRRLHLPCPLIFLWHNDPEFCPSVDDFCNKYHLTVRQRRILTSVVGKHIFRFVHNLFNTLMFSYIAWRADALVLLSETFLKGFLPARLFPKKVIAIPNFLQQDITPSFQPEIKAKEVIYMGRLDNSTKRIDLLLKIWQQIELKYHIDDWQLLICGGGQDGEMLQQLATDLNLQHVQFRGFVEPKVYYSRASIICMTSLYEGLSMVLLEAQAHGCVPLVFDTVDSAFDIIENEISGFIIPEGNTELYAEKLYYLMTHPTERLRMAKAAPKSIAKFNPDAIMGRWEELMNACMHKAMNEFR